MANIIHQKFPRYSIDWLIYGDNDSQETLHDNIVRIPLYNNYETMLFPPVLPADEILIFSSTLAANAQIAITYADERFNPDSRKSVLLLRKKAVAEEILPESVVEQAAQDGEALCFTDPVSNAIVADALLEQELVTDLKAAARLEAIRQLDDVAYDTAFEPPVSDYELDGLDLER